MTACVGWLHVPARQLSDSMQLVDMQVVEGLGIYVKPGRELASWGVLNEMSWIIFLSPRK